LQTLQSISSHVAMLTCRNVAKMILTMS